MPVRLELGNSAALPHLPVVTGFLLSGFCSRSIIYLDRMDFEADDRTGLNLTEANASSVLLTVSHYTGETAAYQVGVSA